MTNRRKQLMEMQAMTRRNKYGNRKTTVDGYEFASKAEALRYQELKLMVYAGEISLLRLQPRYVLQDAFMCEGKRVLAIEYVADFEYFDNTTKTVIIEDVKGVETAVFRLKHKLFQKRYSRSIRIIPVR